MSIPGQTMGVSTFTDSLISSVDISRDNLTTAYLWGTITSAMLLTWVGKKYDQYGARPIAVISTLIMGMILLYLSQSDKIIEFVLGTGASWLGKVVFMFFGFFILRFSGQGALTMVSRNMMMKWFEKRRGTALGFSNVATSLGFSSAPVFFEFLIQSYSWRMAWVVLAAIVGIGFTLYIVIFYRDNPEASGLKMDGDYVISEKQKKNLFPVIKEFTLPEARRTFSFWVFTIMLSVQAMYVTGLTFNITSIFETVGLTRSDAVQLFLPSSVVAVLITLSVSRLSDYIRLKYLLYIKGLGAIIALVGLITLGEVWIAKYLLIFGNGILMGLYSVVLSVTWPRYFGKLHLGAISGHAVTYIVLASAIGPKLFSWSLSYQGSYGLAGWICIGIFTIMTTLSFWANNPQEKYRN